MKKKKKLTISKNTISGKIKPLGDRVLIKELSLEDAGRMTESGIIIPDTAEKDRDSKKGKVVAVGAGKYEDGKIVPMSVSVGDTVLFGWGDKVKLDGEEYYLVRESEITATLKS